MLFFAHKEKLIFDSGADLASGKIENSLGRFYLVL